MTESKYVKLHHDLVIKTCIVFNIFPHIPVALQCEQLHAEEARETQRKDVLQMLWRNSIFQSLMSFLHIWVTAD